MTVRSVLLYELSRRLQAEPSQRTLDGGVYQSWRRDSLAASWKKFKNVRVSNLDILDFGCGDGHLSFFLSQSESPRSVVGVDLDQEALVRARKIQQSIQDRLPSPVRFVDGRADGVPLEDESVDVIVAVDCLEHVMNPLKIFREWKRVLRPGGVCLIEWSPYKGPWGPHMESLIPVPWAHVVFGQEAMFRAAERLYDLPGFSPRHWDLDEFGHKKPNKWRNWSSFAEQNYINELDLKTFRGLVAEAGLDIARLDSEFFGGGVARRVVGRALMSLPGIGEYFTSNAVIQLRRTA